MKRIEALIETYLQNKFHKWLKAHRERMMEVRNGRKVSRFSQEARGDDRFLICFVVPSSSKRYLKMGTTHFTKLSLSTITKNLASQ